MNTSTKNLSQSNSTSKKEQFRFERSSLNDSVSVLSNLSLRDVFDTKKQLNKTTHSIAFPLPSNGVIEEEDSNMNLYSMNTFNMKSNFNKEQFEFNNDNINVYEEIEEEYKQNNYEEIIYDELLKINNGNEINVYKISNRIISDIKDINERKAIAFYNMLLVAQKIDVYIKQDELFGKIIKCN